MYCVYNHHYFRYTVNDNKHKYDEVHVTDYYEEREEVRRVAFAPYAAKPRPTSNQQNN